MNPTSEKYLVLVFAHINRERLRADEFNVLFYDEKEYGASINEFMQNEVYDKGLKPFASSELMINKFHENQDNQKEQPELNIGDYFEHILNSIPAKHTAYLDSPIYLTNHYDKVDFITLLDLACETHHEKAILSLLNQGASPNVKEKTIDSLAPNALNKYFSSFKRCDLSTSQHLTILNKMKDCGANFNNLNRNAKNVFQNFMEAALYLKQDANIIFDFLINEIQVNGAHQKPSERVDILGALFTSNAHRLFLSSENIDKIFQAGYDINHQYTFESQKKTHVVMDNFASACVNFNFSENNVSSAQRQQCFEYVYENHPFDLHQLDMENLNLLALSIRQQNLYIMTFLLKHDKISSTELLGHLMYYEFASGIHFALDEHLFGKEELALYYPQFEKMKDENVKTHLYKEWLEVQLPLSEKRKKPKI